MTDLATPLLVAHLVATLYMTGLIAFVQLVHYPLFEAVGEEAFAAYHARHTATTGLAVGPAMVVELGCAVAIAIWRPAGVGPLEAALGLALVIGLWASTGFVQVPLHRRLAGGFDRDAVRRLVATNRLRVLLWTVRSALAVAWLLRDR